VFSPDNPYLLGRASNLGGSSGFEAMALSRDGRTLYPILEGPVAGDDPSNRRVYEFDVSERRYTGRTWNYRMTQTGLFVSDAVAFGRDQLIVTERDNGQGAAAAWKRAFVIDVPDRRPNLAKREIVDLLDVKDKDGISENPIRPGDFGLGNPFKFPYATVEAVLPISHNELAFVNDTNFGSTGRNANLPDYSDFIIVKVKE
jgi:glycerophosphoryl diester phosphodiesterase